MTASWSRSERAQLCDLFLQVGPDAPTRCEGWTAADLAAHLAVRDGRPDAAVGIVVPRLRGWSERVRRGYRGRPWPELVATVRGGPPRWSLASLPYMEPLTNTVEFFVHHEDVRRAQPGWEPRELPAAFEANLEARLRRQASLLLRRSPVPVTLETPAGRRIVARRGDGVTVRGPVPELLLHVFGRGDAARVDVTGDAAAVAAYRGARLGV